jgi:hypothetical protein
MILWWRIVPLEGTICAYNEITELGNRTWAQTRCNLGTLFEIYEKVPNLCFLAEEVAKWSREKNCSRPLQSNGRGWKTDDLCRVWAKVAYKNTVKTMGTLRTQ